MVLVLTLFLFILYFFPVQGLATVAMASFTRAGPMLPPPASPARSGVTRLPTYTEGLLRFSPSCLMLRITAATQEVKMSVPGATQKTHLSLGNTAVCLPVEMHRYR